MIIYMIAAALAASGEIDSKKFDKLVYYFFWLILMFISGVLGYMVCGIWWCIGLVLFVFVIGLCIILLIKENEKEKNKNEH